MLFKVDEYFHPEVVGLLPRATPLGDTKVDKALKKSATTALA
jgi:hypothetical protein